MGAFDCNLQLTVRLHIISYEILNLLLEHVKDSLIEFKRITVGTKDLKNLFFSLLLYHMKFEAFVKEISMSFAKLPFSHWDELRRPLPPAASYLVATEPLRDQAL